MAEASPLTSSTHTQIAAKPRSTGTLISGWKSRANGEVMRWVRSGSVIVTRIRSPSNGLVRLTSGSLPSSRTARPSSRSLASSAATLSALTERPVAALTASAMPSAPREPSSAERVA